MLFLIQYDRARGSVTSMRTFDDSQRELAEDARLTLELQQNRQGLKQEVVLLEASSEDGLRYTHRRYFEGLAGLAKASSSTGGDRK